MIVVTNIEPRTYESLPTDRKLYRSYRRLLTLLTGGYSNRVVRNILGINGQFEQERMQEALMELEKNGCLIVTWGTDERGTMHYRLTLNPLGKVDGIDAMNEVDVLVPTTVVISRFCDIQTNILGQKKTPTIKDRALVKRLLKDVSLDDAIALVVAYWKQRAERRNGNTFADFYYQYPSLLNDVVDARQQQDNYDARLRRSDAPRPTERVRLEREIAYRTKKGRPLDDLQERLDDLNGEE